MAKKKLSTQEILAAARAEAAKKSGAGPSSDPPPSTEQPAAESSTPEPAASDEAGAAEADAGSPAPADKPADKPKSTKDILAAARAQAQGKPASGDGGAKSADPKPAGAKKPGSTADILAAARAQAGGAGGGAAAKPKSTADVLAAARAQAGGAGKASVERSTAAKAAPKVPAAKAAGGQKPSVQEMLQAVRSGKAAEPAAEAVPAKPKAPIPAKKPRAAKKDEAAPQTRRSFLAALVITPFALAWAAFTAWSMLGVLALARFMFPNVLVEPPTQFTIGPESEYPPGTVSEKFKASRGTWIVHTDQYDGRSLIVALSTVCTHLGCTPNWLEGEQKFKCPCHGSGFYMWGVNFEGPAPRPLERLGIRRTPDGLLEVDKSVKFQEELGQWEDTASYVEA
jgi:cytochrome b6-f complex iron-sulfur subunit